MTQIKLEWLKHGWQIKCYWLIVFFCFVPILKAEPYNARITSDGVAVRSGPGIEFYPVLQLQTGDVVEIHYEQGEWYAIRPPIGSFSWVSAQFVEIGAGNIGTVLADGLASRVGSDYSDDCDTVQVTLNKGESVLILERRATPENPASPAWLRIAPPSGEFRWIHRSAIDAFDTIQQVRHNTVASQLQPSIPTPELATALSATLSAMEVGTEGQGNVAERRGVADATDHFQRAFNELQREAYVVMTRPTDDEVFAMLIQRADELHQIAPTDNDIEKTYHLLESLKRTRVIRQEIAQRRPAAIGARQSLSVAPSHSAPSHSTQPHQVAQSLPIPQSLQRTSAQIQTAGTPPPQRQPIVTAYTPTAAQNSSASLRSGVNVGGFDIVGRLGAFDPLPAEHPPYAIVDENGQIICLISPSENVDLSQHVGQFVGINGVLGEYRQPGKPNARHVTARSVRAVR
jgi:SH3-like domain-containing protein